MSELPTVCVIGAGAGGLVTGKALGDWGIPYECFDRSDDVGGNWYFQNPNGLSSAYRSLHIDTSKSAISFRDFPMPEHYPDYPHHSEVLEWLRDYADAFGLRERIRFGTTVERAQRGEGGGWRITLDDGEERSFDALVVATGHHWDPRLPAFPGEFDGETLHSHHYIDPTEPLDLRGKRVLVVGIGNSAVDITCELARKGVAERVVISTRSGAFIIPKYIFGKPVDQVVRTIPTLPLGPQRAVGRVIQRLVSGRMEDFGLPTPNHRFLEAHPTVSSELLLRLGSGDASAKPNVAELRGRTVAFEDGSEEEFDAIIFATGYNISFPFFSPDFMAAAENRLPLYKRIFKPGIDDLAFVGFAQVIPTVFPFCELQAKLVARYLGGDWAPPDVHEMERGIARDDKLQGGHFVNRPRHTMEVDWYLYEHNLRDELAAGRRRARNGGAVQLAGRAAPLGEAAGVSA